MKKRIDRSGVPVILALCMAVLLPVTSAEVRSPSRFVPGDAATAPAREDQISPFVASGDGTVLAVWSDNRSNATAWWSAETAEDILAMRLDADGNPIDALPFVISAAQGGETSPQAAWNGTHWLVVFQGYDQQALNMVRVAPDGTVVDPEPIPIFGLKTGTWAVASDGDGWVIAAEGTQSSYDLAAIRVSASGAILDAGARSLVPATYFSRSGLKLAHAGGVYLMTWNEGSQGGAMLRFDTSLEPLDPAPVSPIIASLGGLASSGSTFYAVWQEQLPDFTIAVKGTRIDTAGQTLDGGGVNISASNPPGGSGAVSVTWAGADWRVTWPAAGGLRIARVDAGGHVLDPGGSFVAGVEPARTASAGNGTVQTAWQEFANNNYDALTGHVDADLAAGPLENLSLGAPAQLYADVATSGSGYLLVYQSSTASQRRVVAQPLDAAGDALTAEPVELDSGDFWNGPGTPVVAWNGSTYLVAWGTTSGVVAQRIAADGTLVDATPFVVLDPGFGRPAVEALGGDFLVVGRVCGSSCHNIAPVASRVRGSDGAVLDSPPIALASVFASNVRATTVGGRWLVAWRNNVSHDDSTAVTRGVFIDASGVKDPQFDIHGYYSSTGGNGIPDLDIASSGSVALMVQSQELTSGVENDLLGRLVDASGNVRPMVNLTPWAGNQYRPRVAWDGTQFVVVFQDQKNRFSPHGLGQLDDRSDLVAMRVADDGTILDPEGFVFSNSPLAEASPNVTASGGTTLIAGSLVRDDGPWCNYRIGYELFGADGNAWPVANVSASPAGGDVPLTVDFSSVGSLDPDGAVSGYSWDFGDGAGSTQPNPSHQYVDGGPYVATLKVTDDGGASSLQGVLVGATEPNQPPVAVASANVLSGPAPLSVIFYAAGSYDPDGFIGNVEWTFGDGGTYWGATAYHTFSQSGSWNVDLTVYDSSGGTGTDSLTITVDPPLIPAPPTDLSAVTISTSWINLYWNDASNNEDGFQVERCTGDDAFCAANPGAWILVGQPGVNTELFINNEGVLDGTTYTYRVRSYNVSGGSAWSNTATTSTPLGPPPPTPGGFGMPGAPMMVHKMGPAGTELRVSWDDATCPAHEYIVLWGDLADVERYECACLGSVDPDADGSFDWLDTPGQNIWFVVVGADGEGTEGSWGMNSSGAERNAVQGASACSVAKETAGTCLP